MELLENRIGKDMDREERKTALKKIGFEISKCQKCKLHECRNKTVFGMGNVMADIVVCGESPGREEDEKGRPFVGRAGGVLDSILMEVGLSRKDIFILNVVKCRPPKNRDPEEEEIESCLPYLKAQLDIISPKIIVTLGKYASQTIIGTQDPIGKLRGTILQVGNFLVLPTYHPAYVLRNPSAKEIVVRDIKMVMEAEILK